LEDALTIDDAIRDLLDVSTDVASVAVFDEAGEVVASGPGAAGEGAGAAVAALWDTAVRHAGADGLDHLVVPLCDGAVVALEGHGHRIVAVTGPKPAVALLLFDLRTCLGDAYAATEEAR
jgi:hypothetical protein